MNLLILAVAMFAIIAFFMSSFMHVANIFAAQSILGGVSTKAASLSTSDSYCDAVIQYFPREIRSAGSSFYYALKISVVDSEYNGEPVNYIVFSVFPRSELVRGASQKDLFGPMESPNAIAAESARTFADVQLFEYNIANNRIEKTNDFTVIDPQGNPYTDGVVLVKQVDAGKETIYVVPCTTSGNVCSANARLAGCLAKYGSDCAADQEGFRCLPSQ